MNKTINTYSTEMNVNAELGGAKANCNAPSKAKAARIFRCEVTEVKFVKKAIRAFEDISSFHASNPDSLFFKIRRDVWSRTNKARRQVVHRTTYKKK